MKNQIARFLVALPFFYQVTGLALDLPTTQALNSGPAQSVPAQRLQVDMETEYEAEFDFSGEIVENLEALNRKPAMTNLAHKGTRHEK